MHPTNPTTKNAISRLSNAERLQPYWKMQDDPEMKGRVPFLAWSKATAVYSGGLAANSTSTQEQGMAQWAKRVLPYQATCYHQDFKDCQRMCEGIIITNIKKDTSDFKVAKTAGFVRLCHSLGAGFVGPQKNTEAKLLWAISKALHVRVSINWASTPKTNKHEQTINLRWWTG